MKKSITALICGFAVALTLGISAVAIRQALAVCGDSCSSTCGTDDVVVWATQPTQTNALGCSGSTASFNEDLCFQWSYQSPPDLGELSFVANGSGSSNIASVTYNPEYLTNPGECCTGTVTINASGTLISKNQNGTLKSKGWMWPPYKENFHTLTITACP